MIKEYRKQHNLTLAKMERLTGVDSSYINKMERNEIDYIGKPSYEKVMRVIRMDNRLNQVRAAKAYTPEKIKKGSLINFIRKILGVKK